VVLRARNRHYRAVFEVETADADHDGVPDVYQETPGRDA
jgi:NhaA family Na+:H+ antiporter